MSKELSIKVKEVSFPQIIKEQEKTKSFQFVFLKEIKAYHKRS